MKTIQFPKRFTLKLADGRFVGSPANTATTNPRLAGVWEPAYPPNVEALERVHGPLEVSEWQPSGILRK